MPNYDATNFSPPAPIALVSLRNPELGTDCADIPMLIDLGADATLIPYRVANLLGLNVVGDQVYELAGFDGSLTTAQAVRLEMVFFGKNFRGQFLLTDLEYGIPGRNVLNSVVMAQNLIGMNSNAGEPSMNIKQVARRSTTFTIER